MTKKAGTTQSERIGINNRRAVLKTILLKQPISRTAVAEQTGLTGASVSRITRDLIAFGVIRERAEDSADGQPNKPGRRFISLDVDPEAGYLLGLSLNAFEQQITLTDLQNRVVEQVELKFKDLSDPDAVLETVIGHMRAIAEKCRSKRWPLIGGAVAITGAIDPLIGVVRYAPVLEWREVALGERLEAALQIPFLVESLPNALNLAETRFGAATQYRNLLLVNCALGIGASLHLDGRLVRSTDYTAGMTGSVRYPFVTERDLTLDEVTAGMGVISRVDPDCGDPRKRPPDEMAAKLLQIISSAEKYQGRERDCVSGTGHALGNVLSLYAGLIHPKAIILTGPLGRCEIYVSAVRKAFESLCRSDCVMPSLISSDMTYQGAVRWLALHEHLVNRDWDNHEQLLKASA